MNGDLMQIGEVAERAGLSLRTIRYYEEVVAQRCEKLREQLDAAQGFVAMLAKHREGLP